MWLRTLMFDMQVGYVDTCTCIYMYVCLTCTSVREKFPPSRWFPPALPVTLLLSCPVVRNRQHDSPASIHVNDKLKIIPSRPASLPHVRALSPLSLSLALHLPFPCSSFPRPSQLCLRLLVSIKSFLSISSICPPLLPFFSATASSSSFFL
jgi:hypothetical protein